MLYNGLTDLCSYDGDRTRIVTLYYRLKAYEGKYLWALMCTGDVSIADTGDLKIVIAYGIG
jgi:hypothetical protein